MFPRQEVVEVEWHRYLPCTENGVRDCDRYSILDFRRSSVDVRPSWCAVHRGMAVTRPHGSPIALTIP